MEAKTCSKRCGPAAADPELAEGVVAQGVAEGGEALVEDLLAVRDEEEARARQHGAQARVVDGGHDGLAGAGGGDEQVPVVAALAGERDLLEQALLERLEARSRSGLSDERGLVGRRVSVRAANSAGS